MMMRLQKGFPTDAIRTSLIMMQMMMTIGQYTYISHFRNVCIIWWWCPLFISHSTLLSSSHWIWITMFLLHQRIPLFMTMSMHGTDGKSLLCSSSYFYSISRTLWPDIIIIIHWFIITGLYLWDLPDDQNMMTDWPQDMMTWHVIE